MFTMFLVHFGAFRRKKTQTPNMDTGYCITQTVITRIYEDKSHFTIDYCALTPMISVIKQSKC